MNELAHRAQPAAKTAALLEKTLRGFRGDLTVADAATRGGIALREAEQGLFHLASEYRGHLKATASGELVFSFPRGLKKLVSEGRVARVFGAVGRGVLAVGRFVVRAWVSVVLVGYAVVLLGVLLAMAMRSDDNRGSGAVLLVLRVMAEALFWTFHPFSPVYFRTEPAWMRQRRRLDGGKVPFYEKVNRFVFGPPRELVDPREVERDLLAEIRRLNGRVGPGDIMRVTGMPREEAEARLCRLVLDYDGEIDVSEAGAVVYRFPALLRSAASTKELERAPSPRPIWSRQLAPRPVTGNPTGTNFWLAALNGFNLAASSYALSNDLTLERLSLLLQAAGERAHELPPELAAALAEPAGTPVVLGVIPFAFSAALFALPASRALSRRAERRRVAKENGRRALLKAVLDGRAAQALSAAELAAAWTRAAGATISEKQLIEEARTIGGEPDVNEQGEVIIRFPDLDREQLALAEARRTVSAKEKQIGEIVFSSDS